ncbi:MAG: nucleoside recognition domain-containing protein [Clostridia bacterium]|nr:nucleoside recognition domain-containing protein [Clostridia bacterium]
MMNYIWAFIMVISIICALITGRIDEVSQGFLNGAQEAVEIVLQTLGLMCLWSGIMDIADKGGITTVISKLFKPLLKKLFKDVDENKKAFKAICMNITANLLGLGNAATPLGIKAMKELKNEAKLDNSGYATNSMIMFVVINTASLQLIPTMVSSLRIKYGSLNPFDVLPEIWIVSISALIVGISAAKLFERRDKKICRI